MVGFMKIEVYNNLSGLPSAINYTAPPNCLIPGIISRLIYKQQYIPNKVLLIVVVFANSGRVTRVVK